MATTNYNIDYNDERFTQVENDKKAALGNLDKTYDEMINNSDKYYEDQINASKEWADKQTQLQQEQTDFAIDKIEQQKEQAKKDYTKEQSGAYVDWQKQSDQYGANAEQMASQGLQNTGYSESSQVSMYNTYQNRVATAREVYNQAVLNYNNSIQEARLQNNSILAEIAYNALQKQLELSIQGFQYKNTLLLEKANKKTELDNIYYTRYQDVLQQINHENALAEQIRQHNEKMAEEKRQYNESLQLQKDQFKWQQAQAKKTSSGGSGSKSKSKIKSKSSSSSTKKSSTSRTTRSDYGKIVINNAHKKVQNSASATSYLNKLIASGASKDKVSNEIAIALREGAITKAEATKLRNSFTPRGIQY